ncbi:MAG TPA: DUF4838 domain-containing protein [Candidatus Brocadiia bacterium]|nr:DUF4838 domain-containing protein [Candidatus Brocadiia bacterium]
MLLRAIGACCLVICLAAAPAQAKPGLTSNGQPTSVIVIAADASPAACAAAAEIQRHIQEISGALVPIADAPVQGMASVFIGESDWTRRMGATLDGLGPEGIRVKSNETGAAILGVDEAPLPGGGREHLQGTYYAALAFLEEGLGVRWLWPGELGCVVPRNRDLPLPRLDIAFTPHLRPRLCGGPAGAMSSAGKEAGEFEAGAAARMRAEMETWMARQRLWIGPPQRTDAANGAPRGLVVGAAAFGVAAWLCDETRDASRAWWQSRPHGAESALLLCPSASLGGGAPLVYTRRIEEDLRLACRAGAAAADLAGLAGHWASEGLNYYVAARLMWNPDADAQVIVADYCKAGFGSGAWSVRRYFMEVERLTSQIAASLPQSRVAEMRQPWASAAYREVFTPERIRHLRSLLIQADEQTLRDPAACHLRVRFLLEGLRFVELALALDHAPPLLRREIASFVQAHRFSWAIAPGAPEQGGLAIFRHIRPRADLRELPLFWRASGLRQRLSAVGAGQDGDLWVFAVHFGGLTPGELAATVYVDADNDPSTGGAEMGAEFSLSSDGRGVRYAPNGAEAPLAVALVERRRRILLLGVEQALLDPPLARRFTLYAVDGSNRVGPVTVDTDKPISLLPLPAPQE